MSNWRNELEFGSFKIVKKDKSYEPGDPMLQNRTAMGQALGNNIVILYYEHDSIEFFEVVNTKTGDVFEVSVRDDEKEFEQMWDRLELIEKAILQNYMETLKKISAIKLVREALDVDLKTAKRFIDSEWLWRMFPKKEV
jgi:hypothetical protein